MSEEILADTNDGVDLQISNILCRAIVNAARDVSKRCITKCAQKYNFDADEAIDYLKLESNTVILKRIRDRESVEKKENDKKKPIFLLPYTDTNPDNSICIALKYNGGLFTQCFDKVCKDSEFCKKCKKLADQNPDHMPTAGTVNNRTKVGLMEYVDSKKRKVKPYAAFMLKKNLTKEMVNAEADRLGIDVDPIHFVMPEKKVPKTKGTTNSKRQIATASETNVQVSKKPTNVHIMIEKTYYTLDTTTNKIYDVSTQEYLGLYDAKTKSFVNVNNSTVASVVESKTDDDEIKIESNDDNSDDDDKIEVEIAE